MCCNRVSVSGHHYVHFNNTNVWAFEDLYQDSPYLINEIRNDFISSPAQSKLPYWYNETMPLSSSVFSILGRKVSTFLMKEINLKLGVN